MNFIVIEGLDGAGKSTQISMLQDYCDSKNMRYKFLHFPRTDAPVFGELVSMFLRGELGDIKSVNPYLVAMIYAGDQNDAKDMINEWLSQGCLVILDRYIYSNIAFQCAKFSSPEEKKKLKDWILNLHYNYYKVPKPDLTLFLDVPFEFTAKKLTERRTGGDRDYLKGKQDIHEENLDFQNKVRDVYLSLAHEEENFHLLDCSDGNHSMLPPAKIFEKIRNLFEKS